MREGIVAHDAEVTIAARTASPEDDPSQTEPVEPIEEFFSTHGFEFVDLTVTSDGADSAPYGMSLTS